MKFIKILFIFTSYILATTSVLGQKKCKFQTDTAEILLNRNLDYFLAELKSDTFVTTNDRKDIPRFIKNQLNCFAHSFRIVNPGHPFNSTDIIIKNLPTRQLTFLARSKHILVMCYLMGGVGLSSHVVLVKFDKGKIVDLWKGFCAQDINTVDDLTTYIEMNRTKSWRLNTNMVYF